MFAYIHTNPNLLRSENINRLPLNMVKGLSGSGHTGLGTDSTVAPPSSPQCQGPQDTGFAMNSWRWSHSDTHSSTFPLSTRPARARAGQLRTRLGAPVLPKVLTAQLWVPLLFPALRLNTREHSPACTWLHALCRECQSGWPQL